MARVERPEIGTEMYAVFEHRYYIPGHAAPVMEYCVCKGAVRGFFAGGYTEVSLLFTGPDGFPEPDYRRLDDIGKKLFYTAAVPTPAGGHTTTAPKWSARATGTEKTRRAAGTSGTCGP